MSFELPYHTPLSVDDLRSQGIPAPWTYGLADRTRFGELDALSHINNTAYLRWLETFRVRYFGDYGVSDYTDKAPRIVLKSIGMEFRKEMHIHESYIVTGRTSRMRTNSFTMEYAVWSGDLRAVGQAVIVWLDHEGRKNPIPEQVRATFIARDQTIDDR